MGNFILTLDLSSLYASQAPSFEVLVDGVVQGSFSVSSSYQSTDYELNSIGAVPSTLQIRFKDNFSEGGRSIAVNDIQINGVSIAGGSLDRWLLAQGEAGNIDTTAESGSFGVLPPGEGTDAAPPPTIGSFGGATITGTAGDDDIAVRRGGPVVNDVIDALGGNDIVRSWFGDDAIFLGAGNDRAYAGDGNDTIVAGAGNDYVKGEDGDDDIWGDDGNDSLNGNDGDDTIHGGLGNDLLNGHNDDDTLFGEEGDDKLQGGNGIDVLHGGDDNDFLNGGNGNDTLNGDAGNDRLVGGNNDDTLNGGTGDDTLDGGNGIDTLNGGDNDDTLIGRAGNDTLNGDAGDDVLHGGADVDTLNGGADDDTLVGGSGADAQINGDAGNDILHGHGITGAQILAVLRANPNVVYNAASNSFYEYVNSSVTHSVALAAATGSLINGVAGHLVTINSAAENAFVDAFTTNDIWLGGTDAASEGNWVWDGGIDDGLQFWSGASGGTAISGSYENWRAGEPNDFGAGEDFMEMRNGGEWNDSDAAANNDYVIEWDAGLMFSDNAIDTMNGGTGDDNLYGYGGADVLQGGTGDDILVGGDGKR